MPNHALLLGPTRDVQSGGTRAPVAELFAREHHRLDRLLQDYLLDVISADFQRALRRFLRWHRALLDHIEIEETRLLPHVPADARWSARLYRLEHQRIRELAIAHLHGIQTVVSHVGSDRRTRRIAALALLDEAHVLRHMLQHHHAREETALAIELPASLLQRAWPEREPQGATQEPEPHARR